LNAKLLTDLGWDCINAGDYAGAQKFFHAATVNDYGLARAHMSLAEALLATGRFQRGWHEFCWRSYLNGPSGAIQAMTGPPWSGEPMPNGRLLIICDEGFGDMIMFARFIPKAAALCREVVLGWDPVLPPLFGGMPSVASAHAVHATIPPIDAWVLLGDLPGVFGVTVDTIPAETPYLQANPEAYRRWGVRLDAEIPPEKPRVGLFWSGRPTHLQNHRRSLRLAQLAPILDVPGVQFVGIQVPVPEQDKPEIAARENFLDLSESLTSFAETAAVISHLHLVISVDSAVAHLTGALGKPIWTLIYRPADWRWLINRSDTPWYPTMSLFHQENMGDWEPVIRRVAAELESLLRP
jgi:hypothetical protein